jgi:nucleotide-binding universal stress UspA family protein
MNILVALDLSVASQQVLRFVETLTSGLTAKVWLFHVTEPSSGMVEYKGSLRNDESDDRLDTDYARDQIAKKFHLEHNFLLKEAKKLESDKVVVSARVVQGSPTEILLLESEKLAIDMIIVGSHGHGALYNALIGSVSERILHQSNCAVLVVPTHDRT